MRTGDKKFLAPDACEFTPGYIYHGQGIYTASIPKEGEARYFEEFIRLFRTHHPQMQIASITVIDGYLSDMKTVFVVANPPFESTNCG